MSYAVVPSVGGFIIGVIFCAGPFLRGASRIIQDRVCAVGDDSVCHLVL